jgi:hypothetical protein
VRRDTRISHSLSLRGVGVTEQFRASLGDIIAAMPARRMLSGQPFPQLPTGAASQSTRQARQPLRQWQRSFPSCSESHRFAQIAR